MHQSLNNGSFPNLQPTLDGLHSILNKIQRASKNSSVPATDLVFPSEDIAIHITIKHNVAPRNINTKG